MAEEAREKRERRTAIEMAAPEACEAHRHVRQRVVEEHLHRMDDEGVLDDVDEAVEEAGERADAGPIAVREQEQRDHGTERDTAALRHVEDADLVQHDRQREHQRDIDDRARCQADVARVEPAEDQHERAEHGKARCRRGEKFSHDNTSF